ncbi:MAG: Transcriptional regulator, TetR family [Firmicutes bacterium]|nr:Transcriptional regulator, TetR family [Bacillota bacterium]
MRRKGIWSSDGLHYAPSRRALREQQLRQLVVAATQELLAAVGPRAFTVKEAARRAGVARTTVYKYFRDKAGLLAVCRAHVARVGSRQLKWSATAARAHTEKDCRLSGLRPGLTAVRHAVLALVEGLQVQSDLFLLTAGEAVRSRRAPSYPYGDLPAPLPRQFFRAVADLLRDAKTRGELKPSVDPRQVAVWVAALWWHELTIRGPRFDQSQPEAAGLADQLDSLLTVLSVA